jgi:hypothetical protein
MLLPASLIVNSGPPQSKYGPQSCVAHLLRWFPGVLLPLHRCMSKARSIWMQVTKPTVEEAIEFVTHIEQNLQVGGCGADACPDCLAAHCMSVHWMRLLIIPSLIAVCRRYRLLEGTVGMRCGVVSPEASGWRTAEHVQAAAPMPAQP